MSIVASGKTSKLPPAGWYQAVCVDVIDQGAVGLSFNYWEHRVGVVFELDKLAADGRPFTVSKSYNLTLDETSDLRRHLCAWRGRQFSLEELEGFDLEQMIGVPCNVRITHVGRGMSARANVDDVIMADKDKAYNASGHYQRARNHGTDNQELRCLESISQKKGLPISYFIRQGIGMVIEKYVK
jgi:hypothetical protein